LDLILSNLLIPIEDDGIEAYGQAAARTLGSGAGQIAIKKILNKTIDMSDQEQFFYRCSVVVTVDDGFANQQRLPRYSEPIPVARQPTTIQDRPLVVGFGPAGMFAALELVADGLQPIILERGKRIEERSLDVQRFIRDRELDPESNIQFGEGGAGSYSDGKLFSRRDNNSSYVNRVLQTFIKFGAPPEIGYISKPHLGTDLLCVIVRNIRNHILERGGEIVYGAKMTDLLVVAGAAVGIVVNGAQEYLSTTIFIALGHSAHDTLAMLQARGVALEQKPIAVGVRIEHPAALINRLRYGDKYHHFPGLGAATYSFNYTNRIRKRGVYTFCMCPGGEVVNASCEQGQLVLNGMSDSRRALPFSNAALVVSCHGDDYPSASPLAGIEFQKAIEHKAFLAGGGRWGVPAQNLADFIGDEDSIGLHEGSCRMGAVPADLRAILPGFVIEELLSAFRHWREEAPLFVSQQAILLAAETRTSSPVRIKRDGRFESITIKNVYPLGEGSGYTGGITSSAADAIRAVAMQRA
jgi:hypothetical protein